MGLGDVVSIVGALGIGSFIGQYLIGAQQRRTLRGDVLAKLDHVERVRWADGERTNSTLVEAMRELEASALIARLPRRAIVHYRVLVFAAYWISQDSFERFPDPEEGGGGIPAGFADVVRASAGEVSRLAWSPWSSRPFLGRRLKGLMGRADHDGDEEVERAMKRSQGFNGF